LSNSIDAAFGVAYFILRNLLASLGLDPTTPFCYRNSKKNAPDVLGSGAVVGFLYDRSAGAI